MPSRLTLMMILAGGLYLGPFLAGLSRQPPWAVVVFAVLLVVWSVLYRSGSWPRQVVDLARPEVLAISLLLVSVMLALAGLVFLAGRGLSVVVGVMLLPLWVALALPALSLITAMLVQSPRKAAEMDALLDGALRQLQGLQAPPEPSGLTTAAEALARQLALLPEEAGEAEVRAVIGEPGDLDAALLAAIDRMGLPPPRPARLAAVLIVTDLAGAPGLAGRAEAAWVFDLARGDPQLEILFARRAVALLAGSPDLRRDMPYSYDVAMAAEHATDMVAARLLTDLRDRLNDLEPPDENSCDLDSSGS